MVYTSEVALSSLVYVDSLWTTGIMINVQLTNVSTRFSIFIIRTTEKDVTCYATLES